MRSNTVLAVVILLVVLCGGILTAQITSRTSDVYVSASRELLVMTEAGMWERAAETLGAYQERWDKTLLWLQLLINHDDTDDVTLAMTQLEASIRQRDTVLCAVYCNEWQESARHIYHRDALTLANIL